MENRKIEVPSSHKSQERIPKKRDWGEDEERISSETFPRSEDQVYTMTEPIGYPAHTVREVKP